MSAPTNTMKPATQQATGKGRQDGETAPARTGEEAITKSGTDRYADLAAVQEDATEQAEQLTAVEVLAEARGGSPSGHDRGEQLRLSAREELLAELRSQEQSQAREQLAQAARSGEEAVAGLAEGIAVIIRSMVPAALLRPENLIETTYALADQGLRVSRSLALTMAGSARTSTVQGHGRTT